MSGPPERRRVPLLILDDPINNPFGLYHPENCQCGIGPGSRRHPSNRASWEEDARRQWDSIAGQGPSGIRNPPKRARPRTDSPHSGKGRNAVAWVVTFTPLVVPPFSHLQLPKQLDDPIGKPSASPLLVGHREGGQKMKTRRRIHLRKRERTKWINCKDCYTSAKLHL